MTSANSAIASVNAAIANINTNITAANSGLSTTNTTFATVNTTFATINTNMTAANSAIASVNAAIANINTNITAANSGLSTTNTTFGTINTTFATINTNMTAANSGIAALNASMTQANSAISASNSAFGTVNSQVSGVYTLANTALVRSGGTMTGNINMTPGAAGYIIQPQMLSYREYQNNLGIVSSGTLAIDCSTSNYFQVTLGASVTSVTFSNIPASTQVYSFNLIVVQNATGTWTITWPATVKWSGGQIPPATTAANAVDVWSFMTYNGGTTWIGSLAVKNAS